MNYFYIKSKDSVQYKNCLYAAKLYEERFFNGLKNLSKVILDDVHNKVIVKNDIEYTLTPELYLDMYNDLVEYRKTLWKQD